MTSASLTFLNLLSFNLSGFGRFVFDRKSDQWCCSSVDIVRDFIYIAKFCRWLTKMFLNFSRVYFILILAFGGR